jgi:uncharacterized protein (TIRG00374 family)
MLFLGIGAGLIYLILRGITPEEKEGIKKAAAQANYFWIGVSVVISFLSHLIRALRWKMLIEPTGHKVGTRNTFSALLIGYLANYALPRLGEVTRCGVLSKYEKTPFTSLLGTVIVERAIDLLSLIVLFFLMMLFCFNQVYTFVKKPLQTFYNNKINSLVHLNLLVVLIVLVIVGAGIFIFLKKKKAIWDFAGKYMKNFWDGIKSIGMLKNPLLFWIYSILIWLAYLLSAYFCFFSFTESSHLPLTAGLVILVFGSLGVIATPGGTGAYQILVIKVLTRIFLISFPVSFTIAWMIWGSQALLIVFLGLLSLLLLPILNKNEEARVDTIQNT